MKYQSKNSQNTYRSTARDENGTSVQRTRQQTGQSRSPYSARNEGYSSGRSSGQQVRNRKRKKKGASGAVVAVLCVIIAVLIVVIAVMAVNSKKQSESPTGSSIESGVSGEAVSDEQTQEDTSGSQTREEADTSAYIDDGFEPEAAIVYDGAPTDYYHGAEDVINHAVLTPQTTGFDELDALLADFIDEHTDSSMDNFERLWSCYNWLVLNSSYATGVSESPGKYSASDKTRTPDTVLWAIDFFNTYSGDCKNYGSACAYLMQALGYDAHIMTGYVPRNDGGTIDHCWALVYINGDPYYFDIQLDNNYYTRERNNGSEDPPDRINFCRPDYSAAVFYTEDKALS